MVNSICVYLENKKLYNYPVYVIDKISLHILGAINYLTSTTPKLLHVHVYVQCTAILTKTNYLFHAWKQASTDAGLLTEKMHWSRLAQIYVR